MSHPTTSSISREQRSSDGSSTRSSKKASSYDHALAQMLVDGGIYPHAYTYPDGKVSTPPKNWDTIKETLAQRRASLSPSHFSGESFTDFVQEDADVFTERGLMTYVIPIVAGTIKNGRCVGRRARLTNLSALTDDPFAVGTTDYFYGACPEQLDRGIRDDLHHHIIPSTRYDLPMAPNFFLAVEGPDGKPIVMQNQACYDGALGARGMHSLQAYGQEVTGYDGYAYTITCSYLDGTLKMFTSHLTEPRKDGRPEYHLKLIKGWCMTGDIEAFREGATWFRNGRDLAENWRDDFIKQANERSRGRGQGNNTPSPTAESFSKENTLVSGPVGLLESETSEDELHDTN